MASTLFPISEVFYGPLGGAVSLHLYAHAPHSALFSRDSVLATGLARGESYGLKVQHSAIAG